MKNTNYYVIHGWMINELELSGIDLQLFAIIYGFSQDSSSVFSGSLNYLCGWTGKSKPTIINSLKKLVVSEYIDKTTKIINNLTFNTYKVSLMVVKKLNGGSKETLPGGSKETLPGVVKKLNPIYKNNKEINNKEINNKEILENSIYVTYSFFKDTFQEIWLNEFLPLKKKKKASASDRALKSQLNKIALLSNNDYSIALEILEKSVNSGWTDFYELKSNNFQKEQSNGVTNSGKKYSKGKKVIIDKSDWK